VPTATRSSPLEVPEANVSDGVRASRAVSERGSMGISADVDEVFSGIVLFAIATASAFLLVEQRRIWSGTSRHSCMWQLAAWLRVWRRGARAGVVVTELRTRNRLGSGKVVWMLTVLMS
jgi:hypothetical protein